MGPLIVHPITPQPVGVLTLYPGISADVVGNFLRQPVRALILRSYGVANAALALCVRCGIPVVASQDWHPQDHGSFAVNAGQPVNTLGTLDGLAQIWWPVHCVQNTAGADPPRLNHERLTAISRKGERRHIDSYSTFFDNGCRAQTALDGCLRARQIDRLTVMGLATDYCVKYSVLDALHLGYGTEVLTDGCRGVNLQPQDSEEALQEMTCRGAELLTLDAFTARLTDELYA